jgi:hypothetical protein
MVMSMGVPQLIDAEYLTGKWVGVNVKVPRGKRQDGSVYYREGEISMITHCRKYTRIRLGTTDIKVHPEEIIERI